MNAHRLLSRPCSNSTFQSLQEPRKPLYQNPSSLCPSKSFAYPPSWVYFGTRNYKHCHKLVIKKSLVCRNCIKDGEDLRMLSTRKQLAVFVSGGGSNFRSIHEASLQGAVNGDIAVLVTSKKDCGGAAYARDNGIPVILFPSSKNETSELSATDLVTTLRKFEVDFILLAGYLKLIPAELIRSYPRSILNIHPSLLPAFGGKGYYGMKVHKAVIASGARFSGPTIHFVDEHYDTGRILAQRVVPVFATDSVDDLAARVLHEEHQLYVEVASALCDERVVWREDGVPLIKSKEHPDQYC